MTHILRSSTFLLNIKRIQSTHFKGHDLIIIVGCHRVIYILNTHTQKNGGVSIHLLTDDTIHHVTLNVLFVCVSYFFLYMLPFTSSSTTSAAAATSITLSLYTLWIYWMPNIHVALHMKGIYIFIYNCINTQTHTQYHHLSPHRTKHEILLKTSNQLSSPSILQSLNNKIRLFL